MSNTERDKLAAVISQAVGGWNPATAAITNVADAILAEFMPEHDREVTEKAFESFLSYRLLPDDVREYMTEYVKARRES